MAETAIDINSHIITQTGNMVTDDYYESFIRTGALKIISLTLAEKLATSAVLRNRLVHEYDFINHEIVLDVVKLAENLYPQYIEPIERYISI